MRSDIWGFFVRRDIETSIRSGSTLKIFKRKLPEFSGADPAQVVVPWRYINNILHLLKYRWVYDGNNSATITISHSVTSSFFYSLLFAIAPSVLDTCLSQYPVCNQPHYTSVSRKTRLKHSFHTCSTHFPLFKLLLKQCFKFKSSIPRRMIHTQKPRFTNYKRSSHVGIFSKNCHSHSHSYIT